MTDAELVAASRRGEREAFGQLVARYQDVVCAVSYSSTRDWSLSEDVAQDTFIAAWRQLDQLRETGRLRSWLVGIARNLARKARRRVSREEEVDTDLPALDGTPFEHTAQAEAEQVVRDALTRVPDAYREALVLYYGDNRSVRDVAAALGISEAAALQRLTRGRRHLADGVTDLVERTLRGAHVRRTLVPGVIAGITAIAATSRVDASPAKGSTMLKIAIAAVALSAAGTTAIVVHHSSASAPAPAAAAAPAPTPVEHAAVAKPATPAAPTAAPALAKQDDGLPPGAIREPEPEDVPSVDRATVARLHLYEGPGRGPDHAPVTIVVFQDNICPYCGRVLGTIDQLWDEYPNKLRLVVKQFPVHDAARLSAEASYAADAQGKFWEMHDLLFQHEDEQSRDALIKYAKQIGLDVEKFTAALDKHEYAPAVKADQEAGKDIGVDATPTFLINGRKFIGARSIEQFRATIDQALQD